MRKVKARSNKEPLEIEIECGDDVTVVKASIDCSTSNLLKLAEASEKAKAALGDIAKNLDSIEEISRANEVCADQVASALEIAIGKGSFETILEAAGCEDAVDALPIITEVFLEVSEVIGERSDAVKARTKRFKDKSAHYLQGQQDAQTISLTAGA